MLSLEEVKAITKHKNFTIQYLSKITNISMVLLNRKIHEPIENEIYHYEDINYLALKKYLNKRQPKLNFDFYIEKLDNKVFLKRGRKEKPKLNIKLEEGTILDNIGEIKCVRKSSGRAITYLLKLLNEEYKVYSKTELLKIIKERSCLDVKT